MPPPQILDPATLDLTRVVADRAAIRKILPHRGHMEQLTAVVLVDREQQLIAGYRDVTADEFWVSGHFPGLPLFPGVLQCEAAAQLLAYFAIVTDVVPGHLLGLGGLDEVRFRGAVRPGDRLVIVAKGVRVHRRQTIFNVQGFVDNAPVFDGQVMGLPIAAMDAVDTTA
jgi:3-hydroxyacyl-[acyl-carrier-protein] dehydratase